MTVSRREVLSALQTHPQSERLCQRAAEVCFAAAKAQRADWLAARTVALDTTPLTALTPTEAETPFGNLLGILDRGAQTPVEWSVLSAALALSLTRQWPKGANEEPSERQQQALDHTAWLAAHTGCNAWVFLSVDSVNDAAGEGALWHHVDGRLDAWALPEQTALAVGLMEAGSEAALHMKAAWLDRTGNPTLVALLETSTTSPWLTGEVRLAPRSGVVWTLQAVTGYLFVKTLVRLFARYVLWARDEAKVRVSPRGLEIVSRRHLLGKPLRERRQLIPLSEVRELRRESRYQGLFLYVGIACLLTGSLLGTGLLLDGLRVPGTSPSLLSVGLALLLLGVLLDFWLSRWSAAVAARGALYVKRRKGRGLSVHGLEPRAPDELVERVARLRAFALSPVARG